MASLYVLDKNTVMKNKSSGVQGSVNQGSLSMNIFELTVSVVKGKDMVLQHFLMDLYLLSSLCLTSNATNRGQPIKAH